VTQGPLRAYQSRHPGRCIRCARVIRRVGARFPARVQSDGESELNPSHPKRIVVSGAFDDLRSCHLRFLEEAAKLGELTVLLWRDRASRKSPASPQVSEERLYFSMPSAYVTDVQLVDAPWTRTPAGRARLRSDVWGVGDCPCRRKQRPRAHARGIEYVSSARTVDGFFLTRLHMVVEIAICVWSGNHHVRLTRTSNIGWADGRRAPVRTGAADSSSPLL